MFRKITACFGKEPVNSSRQRELDIAKGIAIIFMVFAHSYETFVAFLDPELSMELARGIYERVLGGVFAAPVFMFCMGISFCYSRRRDAGDMLRRARNTMGIALLLELLRSVIPCFLEWQIFQDPECADFFYWFFIVDILQFAAIAMLVIALFKKFHVKPAVMIAISVGCSVAGQLLQWVPTGSYAGDLAAGYIWRSHSESFFPFLNWLIFPVCGYIFGPVWQRLRDKETFFRLITPISWLITAGYFASMGLMGGWYYFSGGDYYGLCPADALFAFVVCFAMISLGYHTERHFKRAARQLASMGSRVNSIFCIHWTIYYFLYLIVRYILGESFLPQWALAPIAVFVLLCAELLSRLYKKHTKKRAKTLRAAG